MVPLTIVRRRAGVGRSSRAVRGLKPRPRARCTFSLAYADFSFNYAADGQPPQSVMQDVERRVRGVVGNRNKLRLLQGQYADLQPPPQVIATLLTGGRDCATQARAAGWRADHWQRCLC